MEEIWKGADSTHQKIFRILNEYSTEIANSRPGPIQVATYQEAIFTLICKLPALLDAGLVEQFRMMFCQAYRHSSSEENRQYLVDFLIGMTTQLKESGGIVKLHLPNENYYSCYNYQYQGYHKLPNYIKIKIIRFVYKYHKQRSERPPCKPLLQSAISVYKETIKDHIFCDKSIYHNKGDYDDEWEFFSISKPTDCPGILSMFEHSSFKNGSLFRTSVLIGSYFSEQTKKAFGYFFDATALLLSANIDGALDDQLRRLDDALSVLEIPPGCVSVVDIIRDAHIASLEVVVNKPLSLLSAFIKGSAVMANCLFSGYFAHNANRTATLFSRYHGLPVVLNERNTVYKRPVTDGRVITRVVPINDSITILCCSFRYWSCNILSSIVPQAGTPLRDLIFKFLDEILPLPQRLAVSMRTVRLFQDLSDPFRMCNADDY